MENKENTENIESTEVIDNVETIENTETPIGKPIKKQFSMEIAKLRELPFKKKMEYIWDYYKVHIIVFILLAALVGSLINSILNPRPETVLFISWNTGFAMDTNLSDLARAMEENIIEEFRNEKVDAISILTTGEDASHNMANVQRLVAMISAGVFDVFVIDSEQIIEYSESVFIQPLDNLLALVQSLNPGADAKIQENTITAMHGYDDDNPTERVVGVNITDSYLLTELGFLPQEAYFTISISSNIEYFENVAKALILFFEQP